MNIISSNINWYKGYGNFPTLEVLVDKIPNREKLLYHRHWYPNEKFPYLDDATSSCDFWASTEEGYVNFFTHVVGNERGYGGVVVSGKCANGFDFKVKGPWSSNAMEMNQWFPPCHEVVYKERDGQFPDLGYAGAILANVYMDLVLKNGATVSVIENTYSENHQVSDEDDYKILRSIWEKPTETLGRKVTLVIVKPGMTIKESQRAKND